VVRSPIGSLGGTRRALRLVGRNILSLYRLSSTKHQKTYNLAGVGQLVGRYLSGEAVAPLRHGSQAVPAIGAGVGKYTHVLISVSSRLASYDTPQLGQLISSIA
jgi:hypothetical protein